MKKVMTRAWEIAREAVKNFGGSVKSFFAQSLKIAWEEIKGVVEMVELQGSEKQVKWATDIRENMIEVFNIYTSIESETVTNAVNKIKEAQEVVLNEVSAKWFIENRDMCKTSAYRAKGFDFNNAIFTSLTRRERSNLEGARVTL